MTCYTHFLPEPCPRCAENKKRGYRITQLIGRACSGAELGHGTRNHAVPLDSYTALCGAHPGRRSAGWSSYEEDAVTCPRCLKKIEAIKKEERHA